MSFDRTHCPYNPNHIFAEEKYFWHIHRCKDKYKNGHLFSVCRFNRIHILPNHQIQEHQLNCQDGKSVLESYEELNLVISKMKHNSEITVKIEAKQQQQEVQEQILVQGGAQPETVAYKQEQLEQQTIENRNSRQQQEQIPIQECEQCKKILEKMKRYWSKGLKLKESTKKLQKYLKIYRKLENFE